MEFRHILDHAEAEIATARKMFRTGDKSRSVVMIAELGRFITEQIAAGVQETTSIDQKPPEPTKNLD